MKMKIMLKSAILFVLIQACVHPKMTIYKVYPSFDETEKVLVLKKGNNALAEAEKAGHLKIGNMEFSRFKYEMNCDFPAVLNLAKQKAREIGGNIVVVTDHKLPTPLDCACHRIETYIYRHPDLSKVEPDYLSPRPDTNHAIIHIYRPTELNNGLTGYRLFLNDELLCKVTNGYADIFRFNKNQTDINV